MRPPPRWAPPSDEQQLGQTEEANELVHGSPSDIRSSAKHLRDFQHAFERVGKGMRGLDSSHWKGKAAKAFREKFPMHPVRWVRAADACEKAAKALENYADTVKWAQGQAKEAVAKYKKGDAASDKAAKEDPPPETDPGTAPATWRRRSSAAPAASATRRPAAPRRPCARPSPTRPRSRPR